MTINNSNITNMEFVLYHIPKCGGSSIRQYFYDIFKDKYNDDEIWFPERDDPDIIENVLDLKSKKKILLGHVSVNYLIENNIKANYSITCLRNPIDRFISHYYYFIYYKGERGRFNKYYIENPIFKLDLLDIPPEELINNPILKVIYSRISFFICNTNYKFIPENFNKIYNDINYFCIIEDIDNDLNNINQIMNLKTKKSNLIVKNIGKHKTITWLDLKNSNCEKTKKIYKILTHYLKNEILFYNWVVSNKYSFKEAEKYLINV